MKLLSFFASAACSMLLAGRVAAQSGPTMPIPFSSCHPTEVSILQLEGSVFTEGTGQQILNTIVTYEADEQITAGTYNVTIVGGPGGNAPSWADEYSGPLLAVVPLPIQAGQGSFNTSYFVDLGWNNFTVKAYDQNQEEIICFTFDYLFGPSAKKSIHNKKTPPVKMHKKHIKAVAPHAQKKVSPIKTGPTFPLPYSSCTSDSQILPVLGITASTASGSQNSVLLTTVITYESYEEITGGSYNVSASGSDSPNSGWADEYSGKLGEIFNLPLSAYELGTITTQFYLSQGQNNFTITAYDQNGEQVTCFKFGYQTIPTAAAPMAKKSVDANKHMKKHIAAPGSSTGISAPGSSTGISAPGASTGISAPGSTGRSAPHSRIHHRARHSKKVA